MNNEMKFCQSCGMPLTEELQSLLPDLKVTVVIDHNYSE